MLKLQLHSITDLITNSSTVIYTYSDYSVEPLKEMVNEFLKISNIDKTCDDLFKLKILYNEDTYRDLFSDTEEGRAMGWEKRREFVEQMLKDHVSNDTPLPDWAQHINDYGDYPPQTFLYICPLKPEYEKLAELIKKFLYSTKHDSCYDG